MLTKTKLIKLTTVQNEIFMTLYDRDLLVNGQIYAANMLTDPIEITYSDTLQPDQVVIHLIRDADHYLDGVIEIYDYDLALQEILEPANFIGTISTVVRYDTTTRLEAHCQKRHYEKHILRRYSPVCEAIWGDNRCTINREDYKQTIEISHIVGGTVFYNLIEGDIPEFHAPYLEDLLGNKIPILSHDSENLSFISEAHYLFNSGQRYYLYAGCQKTKENCKKYNNYENYLGFL